MWGLFRNTGGGILVKQHYPQILRFMGDGLDGLEPRGLQPSPIRPAVPHKTVKTAKKVIFDEKNSKR